MDLCEKYKGFSKLSISEQGDSASITPVSGDGATEALRAVFSDYPNIKKLTFENTPADMSVLESLKDLETLILPHDYMNYGDGPATSNVRDVSALKHLPKLSDLEVSLRSSDLSGVSELTQLRRLRLYLLSGFDSLNPLGEIIQLEELEIKQSKQYRFAEVDSIPNLEPFAGLTNLKMLDISGNKLRSLEFIQNLTHLKYLNCSNNHIRTLKPLSNLAELDELHVRGNAIRDVKIIPSLKNLTALNFAETKVQDISPLKELDNLTCLCLNGEGIDLAPIAAIRSLRELHLVGDSSVFKEEYPEVDIAPLSCLCNLESLCISSCHVKNLNPLRDSSGLKLLWCWNCNISDLEPLKSLVNLKVLDLSANGNITDISALKNLTNLAAVCIGSNAVTDYSPIRCLPGYKKDWEGGALVWHGVPSDMLRWFNP